MDDDNSESIDKDEFADSFLKNLLDSFDDYDMFIRLSESMYNN